MAEIDVYEEQKQLVLARLRTLDPEGKLMLGGSKEVSVKNMINHIEKNDPFGKQLIKAQLTMIKVLTGTA